MHGKEFLTALCPFMLLLYTMLRAVTTENESLLPTTLKHFCNNCTMYKCRYSFFPGPYLNWNSLGDTAHALLRLCACATDSKARAQKLNIGVCAAPGLTGPQPS